MTEPDMSLRLLAIVDDILTERSRHGLSPRVARDLQLAAQAITQERFRRLAVELGRVLAHNEESSRS